MKLITTNHAKILNELIRISQKVVLCSGWMNKPGIDKIFKSILFTLEKGADVTIFSNEKHTTSHAKKIISKETGIRHYVIDSETKYLHSKLYYFEHSEHFSVIIGSANLTKGGLGKNEELSTLITGRIGSELQLEIISYLDKIYNLVE